MYVLLMYLYGISNSVKEALIVLMVISGVSALVCAFFSICALVEDDTLIHESLKKKVTWLVVFFLITQFFYVAIPSQDTIKYMAAGYVFGKVAEDGRTQKVISDQTDELINKISPTKK